MIPFVKVFLYSNCLQCFLKFLRTLGKNAFHASDALHHWKTLSKWKRKSLVYNSVARGPLYIFIFSPIVILFMTTPRFNILWIFKFWQRKLQLQLHFFSDIYFLRCWIDWTTMRSEKRFLTLASLTAKSRFDIVRLAVFSIAFPAGWDQPSSFLETELHENCWHLYLVARTVAGLLFKNKYTVW